MRILISAWAAMSVVAAIALVPTVAFSDEKVTPVLKTELQGMEGTEANVVLFEVPPGFKTERHIHPGHVFVYVMEGSIVIDTEGTEPKTVSAGEAVYELPNTPMVGSNASSTEGARFVVFQVGETGKQLMVPQPQ